MGPDPRGDTGAERAAATWPGFAGWVGRMQSSQPLLREKIKIKRQNKPQANKFQTAPAIAQRKAPVRSCQRPCSCWGSPARDPLGASAFAAQGRRITRNPPNRPTFGPLGADALPGDVARAPGSGRERHHEASERSSRSRSERLTRKRKCRSPFPPLPPQGRRWGSRSGKSAYF